MKNDKGNEKFLYLTNNKNQQLDQNEKKEPKNFYDSKKVELEENEITNLNLNNVNKLKNEKFEKNLIKNKHNESLYNKKIHDPLKENIDELKENDYNNEIRNIILTIFLNFSKFSKEEFQFLLSYQNLIKILKFAKIMSHGDSQCLLKSNEFDIVFKKANPSSKNLNVNQFNNFLVFLAFKLFRKEFTVNKKMCLLNLITEFFNPLKEIIQQFVLENPSSEIYIHQSTLNKFSEISIDNQIILIVNSVLPGIKNLYLRYFDFENIKSRDTEKLYKNSLIQLIKFCQNYEILPFTFSLDKLAIYFNLINRINIEDITNNPDIKFVIDPKKDIGTLFTLSKFICLLFHIAVISYDKYSIFIDNNDMVSKIYIEYGINLENVRNEEKLILFLEKMQNIEMRLEIGNSRIRTNSEKFFLIPPKEILIMINSNLIAMSNEKIMKSSRSTAILEKEIIKNIQIEFGRNESIDLKNIYKYDSENIYNKIQSIVENLKDIFENYASIGDKTENYNLNLSGYVKFWSDCSLIYENQNNIIKNELRRIKSDINFHSDQIMKDFSDINDFRQSQNFLNPKSTMYKSSISRGKISKSDISIIFNNLCGLRNFDYSTKIKNQFDKNFGNPMDFNNCQNYPCLKERGFLKSNQEVQLLKMNFPIFLKSLEYISKKIYGHLNYEEAMEKFIDFELADIIIKYKEHFNPKKILIDKLLTHRTDEIIDFIRCIVNIIYPHYMKYCDQNELIDFSGVFQFFSDFEIFPKIVNIIQLKLIFFSLHEVLFEQVVFNKDEKEKKKTFDEIRLNKKINLNSLMDALLLASLYVKSNEEMTDIERMLYLMQKMSNSQGVNKIQSRTRPFSSSSNDMKISIKELKDKYGTERYDEMKILLKSLSCFDDIFKE